MYPDWCVATVVLLYRLASENHGGHWQDSDVEEIIIITIAYDAARNIYIDVKMRPPRLGNHNVVLTIIIM